MPAQHIVVDGSNIATEGRSTPSLAQLEEAVAELRKELPDAAVTVIVDATFAHRIDPSELPRFEEAAARGEYVQPPAGAIGRGDAFLLRIAEKVRGVVLSNDSFQEFHGEHAWLFDPGRLLGATPVPGVGWIFTPRTPVRGPRSRQAVREADRAKARLEKAIAAATKEAVTPPSTEKATAGSAARAGGRTARATPQAVNEPLPFIAFIAEHRLGEEVEGVVDSFTSHGAIVLVGALRCYVPLCNLGDPRPRSAREVLRKGEKRRFVVTAFDPHRRGIELALPGLAVVSGRPSEETVEAEVAMARPKALRRRTRAAEAPPAGAPVAPPAEAPPAETPRRRTRAAEAPPAGAPVAPPAEAPPAETPRRRTRAAETPPAGAPVAPPAEAPPAETPRRRTRAAEASPAETPAPAAGDGAAGTASPPARRGRRKAPAAEGETGEVAAPPSRHRGARRAPAVEVAPAEAAAAPVPAAGGAGGSEGPVPSRRRSRRVATGP